jgi:hypothetical protein
MRNVRSLGLAWAANARGVLEERHSKSFQSRSDFAFREEAQLWDTQRGAKTERRTKKNHSFAVLSENGSRPAQTNNRVIESAL